MVRYSVNSIAEYLKLIEINQLTNYIYRGQNEPYCGIQASGFRPYKGGWENDKFYNINVMKKDFYNKVIRNISSDEKKYFLAFCQHHGLPTNLVDFTYSPLIAMFFACQGKKSPSFTIEELIGKETFTNINNLKTDESLQQQLIHNMINELSKNYYTPYSEIYLINKDRLLDITDVIIKSQDDNFFEKLIYDNDVQEIVLEKLEEIFLKNKQYLKSWIINIINCYEENNANIYEILLGSNDKESSERENDKLKSLAKYKKKLLNESIDDTLRDLYCYIFNEIEDENITHGNIYYLEEWEVESINIESLGARIYLMLLINLIQIFNGFQEKINLELDAYFTYQPPNLFDRISNQKGIFIYQPYLYCIEEVYNYGVLSTQKIKPDITIEVNNSQLILEELNYLGINLESVYGDLDNTAKAVVYAHDKILAKMNLRKYRDI